MLVKVFNLFTVGVDEPLLECLLVPESCKPRVDLF